MHASRHPGDTWKPKKKERRPATFEVHWIEDISDLDATKRQANIVKLLANEGFTQQGERGGYEQWVRG